MKCNKCGNEVVQEALFCDNCGSKLDSTTTVDELDVSRTKKVCHLCKSEWDNDAFFCGECGSPLSEVLTVSEDTDKEHSLVGKTVETESMRTCQNCETLNDGEICIICGKAKSKSEEAYSKVREENIPSNNDRPSNIIFMVVVGTFVVTAIAFYMYYLYGLFCTG